MGRLTHDGETKTVDTVLADSEAIFMENCDGGRIIVPSGSPLTTLTFHESHNGTTYVAAYDINNTAVTMTVAAGRSYPLPPTLNPSRFIKITGNADGSILFVGKQAGLVRGQV
jgi:hypothetical protein